MDKVYLTLLVVAAGCLLYDAFSDTTRVNGRRRVTVRILPLALFFWVLVPLIQYARMVF